MTAKSARKALVLRSIMPANVEIKLVQNNHLIQAIYELPFKAAVENKLRCFELKVIHNILSSNYVHLALSAATAVNCRMKL